MKTGTLHSCAELIDFINGIGFLPLLHTKIHGWSAEEMMDEECQFRMLPDGGWEWPLWDWKGSILQESSCAYGKFIGRKATFISQEWWPDFCNYRRSIYPCFFFFMNAQCPTSPRKTKTILLQLL